MKTTMWGVFAGGTLLHRGLLPGRRTTICSGVAIHHPPATYARTNTQISRRDRVCRA
jgi:hypothetical protein